MILAAQSDLSLLTAPAGALGQTYSRYLATASTGIPSSGVLQLSPIGLAAGTKITSITMSTGGQAKTGGTHGWYCILDSGFVLRGVTADQTDAATVWGATQTAYTLALAASYVTTYLGVYWLGVMVTQSAGTMPTFASTATLDSGVQGAPVPGVTSSSGLTVPGTPGVTSYAAADVANATGKAIYGYVS